MSTNQKVGRHSHALGDGRMLELFVRTKTAIELSNGLAATWAKRLQHRRDDGSIRLFVEKMLSDPGSAEEVFFEHIQAEIDAAVELIMAAAKAWEAERLRCEGEIRLLLRQSKRTR